MSGSGFDEWVGMGRMFPSGTGASDEVSIRFLMLSIGDGAGSVSFGISSSFVPE